MNLANPILSPAAFQLLLDQEVGGGERYYNRVLSRPSWPGGKSGVTIGIGYDLGHTPRERFLGDWHALEDGTRHLLSSAIGLTGARAAAAAKQLRRDVNIPWPVALGVFRARTIPFWVVTTAIAFPGAKDLPDDAFGALVSLVFNRGPALRGKNRQDMEDIYDILSDGIQVGDLAKIAVQLREMKAIWRGQGLNGLIARREAEAKLVESCIG